MERWEDASSNEPLSHISRQSKLARWHERGPSTVNRTPATVNHVFLKHKRITSLVTSVKNGAKQSKMYELIGERQCERNRKREAVAEVFVDSTTQTRFVP